MKRFLKTMKLKHGALDLLLNCKGGEAQTVAVTHAKVAAITNPNLHPLSLIHQRPTSSQPT